MPTCLNILRKAANSVTTLALAIMVGVLALPVEVAMIGALPIVASEAGLSASGGRMVAQRLVAWGAANPAFALATTEMVIGFAVSVDPADYTWANLCEVFSDPKSAAMFLAQMLMDIMHLRMAGHSDGGMSPAPRRGAASSGEPAAGASMGNRSASTRPNAAETNSIPGPGHAIAASTLHPTDADYAILRQRVQKLIAVRDDLVRKANTPLQPASTNESVAARKVPPQNSKQPTVVAEFTGPIVAAASAVRDRYALQAFSTLNKRQKVIHDLLPKQGDMAKFHRDDVSMNDLRIVGQVTGDEYSMYTLGAQRLIIRGVGHEVRVPTQQFADALQAGKYGRWSGHTHPPGYSSIPGPADRPNIPVTQSRSGIWADDGSRPFGRTPQDDVVMAAEQRRREFEAMYGKK